MLNEDAGEGVGIETVIVRHHLDDTREVGKEIALVLVGQDGRDGGRVKLDVVVVNLDEVHVDVFRD